MTRAKAVTTEDPATARTEAENKEAPPRRRGRPPGKKTAQRSALTGSTEAKQKASLILEALSGLRSPNDASAAIGVTVNRYYQLETRALQGLIDALEVRPAGRQPSTEAETKKLTVERDRLARELCRAQALVRVAQRAVGLPPPQPVRDPIPSDGKKRRKRRTAARTTRVLARFRTPTAPTAPTSQSAVTAAIS